MKIVGCVIVTLFCAAIGSWYSGMETQKRDILEEMYAFLLKIRIGIKNRMPFNEIASGFVSSKAPVHMLGATREELTDTLMKIIDDGICVDEASAFMSLLSMLGKSTDAREPIRACDDATELVKVSLDKTRKECRLKSGLYTKLGAVIGILVCIIVV